jgi:hypothetical protein
MSNDFEIPNKPSIKAPAKPMPTKRQGAAASVTELKPETPEKVEAPEKQETVGPKYDPNELLRIFDDIIFSGEYVEEVIIKNRLVIKFSTRTAEQIGKIQDALDAAGLQLISSIEQRRSIMSLEQSLVNFNGTDLAGLSEKDRSSFISKLAAPVIAMLLTEMSKFDMKIAAACREEANF